MFCEFLKLSFLVWFFSTVFVVLIFVSVLSSRYVSRQEFVCFSGVGESGENAERRTGS